MGIRVFVGEIDVLAGVARVLCVGDVEVVVDGEVVGGVGAIEDEFGHHTFHPRLREHLRGRVGGVSWEM